MAGNPGNGSGFQVYLPGGESRITSRTEKVSITSFRERILFVDDERQALELGQRVLEYLGYQVTALTSSLEALEVFHRDPQEFDLVITDLAMPLVSGLELAADLVKIRPELPVILYSGFSESVSPEEARQSGIREFVRKPANIADLARAIRRVLDSEEE